MYKPVYPKEHTKDAFKEALIKTLKNVENNIDDCILNDYDKHITNIDIHIKIVPGEVACYNVKKEYHTVEEYNG